MSNKIIPVIDISKLLSLELDERKIVARELGQACRTIGFFYVRHEGFLSSIMPDVFEASHRFFGLPLERKLACSIKRSAHNRGYVEMSGERLQAGALPDLKEAFNVGLDLPEDHEDVVRNKPFRGPNLWPDLPGWKDTILRYYDACWQLGRLLHRGFALDLGLAEDFFEDKLDSPLATLRLLHYPPSSVPQADVPGAGEHTDYGNVTILATDGVAGLEVRTRQGEWISAPHIPGAAVCNIGDCLMRWTNDVYQSTPHRVRIPDRERYSIAFFLDPNPDAIVKAIESCVPEGEAPRYAPISGSDYLTGRLKQTYDHLAAPAA